MRALLLLLLAALATSPPPQQQTARIEGIVFRSDGRTPVARARLLLHRESAGGNGNYATLSEADGRFAISDIAPGQYRLSATLSGFIDSEYGAKRAKSPGSPLELHSGQTLRDLAIRMPAGAVISGRIYDENGQPLAEALVQLLQPRYDSDGRFTAATVASAETNDLGEYRMFWLAPGTYYLAASLPARDPNLDSRYRNLVIHEQYAGEEEVFLPLFYSSSLDSANATPLQIEAGTEVRGVDLALQRFPTVRVRGQLVDATTGQAAANGQVGLRRKQEGWAHPDATLTATADAGGNFDLRRVVPGIYTLDAGLARPAAGARPVGSERVILVGDKEMAGLRVVLQPQPALQGRVLFDLGTPARSITLRWESVNGERDNSAGTAVEDDGTFSATLRPGTYRMNLSGAQEYFIRSARSGSRNILRDGLDVAEGTPEPVEITVASSTATVEGTVSDDNGAAGAGVQVVLIPDRDRLIRIDLFRNVTADSFGHFSLAGVAPGEYRIFAWEDMEPYAFFDSAFLELYESRGVPVQVGQNGTVRLKLKSLP